MGDDIVIDKTKIDETLEIRNYGDFSVRSSISQGIKREFVKSKNWESLDDDKKEALEIIVHKIARVLNDKDCWHDIIGYAKLIEDELND